MSTQHICDLDHELNDFQKKKLLFVFSVFFDINRDGVIEKSDFDLALEKIAGIHKWGKSDNKYTIAKSTLGSIWNLLRSKADANQDDIVTQSEWFLMWSESISHYKCHHNHEDVKEPCDKEAMPDWEKKFMQFMFDVIDISGDGIIDEIEFLTFFKVYDFTETECKIAFSNLTNNKKVKIDREMYRKFWRQYFLGNVQEEPGNWIFCSHL
ncbi:unnamed protein product [Gordionus sp. m RMFG-2023]|uniref:sarcoplasmic calcium-binding proteins II, V, VI, and VII-like n=1 Tax=Gordionus sp. m RMFG-2023 TaxID=3053472 RepID=UPI0030DEF1C1